eukprot:m.245234 g.245234  ORF g.245234 m.245234 type:complete len:79 (-) comp19478_c0_seq17:204-440(-)
MLLLSLFLKNLLFSAFVCFKPYGSIVECLVPDLYTQHEKFNPSSNSKGQWNNPNQSLSKRQHREELPLLHVSNSSRWD